MTHLQASDQITPLVAVLKLQRRPSVSSKANNPNSLGKHHKIKLLQLGQMEVTVIDLVHPKSSSTSDRLPLCVRVQPRDVLCRRAARMKEGDTVSGSAGF